MVWEMQVQGEDGEWQSLKPDSLGHNPPPYRYAVKEDAEIMLNTCHPELTANRKRVLDVH